MEANTEHVVTQDPWLVLPLGEVDYQEAWDLQRRLLEARQQQRIGDVLILLQHPHTYTLGRRATGQNLLLDGASLAQRGIATHWVDRGGDITYHGPGQLVGYPIMDIRRRGLDVHRYLRRLEESLIRALAQYGIKAGRDPAYTGVWVENKKIAAIGIKVSRGVSCHGFALNVNTDLSYFQDIVPCGIADCVVTSMQELLGRRQEMERVRKTVLQAFVEEFGGVGSVTTLAALGAILAGAPKLKPVSSTLSASASGQRS